MTERVSGHLMQVASPPPSPCCNVCRMDAHSGLCIGCHRTLEEIAGWSRMDDAAKRAVLLRVEQRQAGTPDVPGNNPP